MLVSADLHTAMRNSLSLSLLPTTHIHSSEGSYYIHQTQAHYEFLEVKVNFDVLLPLFFFFLINVMKS